jgi:hypothetical protein
MADFSGRWRGVWAWLSLAAALFWVAGCGGGSSGGGGGSGDGWDLPDVPTTGTVSGHVYLVGSTEPISEVVVSCGGHRDTTGSDGAYSLHPVPAGRQALSATKTGYDPYGRTITVVAGETLIHGVYMTPSPSSSSVPSQK